MSHKEKNIDQLFLRKSFHELTQTEKDEIADIAKTESEFNDTKMMLISIEKEISSIQEIEPKEATKKHLITEFNRVRPSKTVRPKMGLGIFFPSSKSFFNKPGVQLIAVAAMVVLIFTLFVPGKEDITKQTDTALVQKKENVSGEKILKEASSKKENELIVDATTGKDTNAELKDLGNINTQNEDGEFLSKEMKSETLPPPSPVDGNNDFTDKLAVSSNVDNNLEKAEDNNADLDVAISETPNDGINLQQENDKDSFSPAVNETISTVTTGNAKVIVDNEIALADEVYDDVTVSPSVADSKKERQLSSPNMDAVAANTKTAVKTSKSLSENEELIKYFYTAM